MRHVSKGVAGKRGRTWGGGRGGNHSGRKARGLKKIPSGACPDLIRRLVRKRMEWMEKIKYEKKREENKKKRLSKDKV